MKKVREFFQSKAARVSALSCMVATAFTVGAFAVDEIPTDTVTSVLLPVVTQLATAMIGLILAAVGGWVTFYVLKRGVLAGIKFLNTLFNKG